jgi:hypothetical protein
MDGFVEISLGGSRDVHKALGIPVHQGEPGTLHLNHDAVATTKSVENVRHGELDFTDLSRIEWFWFLKAVAELATENVPPDKLLITSHVDMGRVWVWIRKVPRVHIYQLHYPIGVGAGS